MFSDVSLQHLDDSKQYDTRWNIGFVNIVRILFRIFKVGQS